MKVKPMTAKIIIAMYENPKLVDKKVSGVDTKKVINAQIKRDLCFNLIDNGELDIGKLTKLLGVTKSTVINYLKVLKEEKRIKFNYGKGNKTAILGVVK